MDIGHGYHLIKKAGQLTRVVSNGKSTEKCVNKQDEREGKIVPVEYIASSTPRAIPGSQIDAMHFMGKIFLYSQTFAPFLINHDKLSVDS